MDSQTANTTLRVALDSWQEHATADDKTGTAGHRAAAELEHIRTFALASIALELRELRLTAQAMHEESIERKVSTIAEHAAQTVIDPFIDRFERLRGRGDE